MKLGDFVEKIINILTFGKGHNMAMWVAKLFGYEDCGCNDRKIFLNNLVFKRSNRLDNSIEDIYIDDDYDDGKAT